MNEAAHRQAIIYELRLDSRLISSGGAIESFLAADYGGTMRGETMANDATAKGVTTRRRFLKRAALAGAAASVLGLLSRGPLSGSKTGDRSIPAGLPGAGSIFQPRNDGRRQ